MLTAKGLTRLVCAFVCVVALVIKRLWKISILWLGEIDIKSHVIVDERKAVKGLFAVLSSSSVAWAQQV